MLERVTNSKCTAEENCSWVQEAAHEVSTAAIGLTLWLLHRFFLISVWDHGHIENIVVPPSSFIDWNLKKFLEFEGKPSSERNVNSILHEI